MADKNKVNTDYEDDDLEEKFVSDDGQSMVDDDSGVKKTSKRMADSSEKGDMEADEIEDDVVTPQGNAGKKTPARKADVSEEAIENLFDGQDLSEGIFSDLYISAKQSVKKGIIRNILNKIDSRPTNMKTYLGKVISEVKQKALIKKEDPNEHFKNLKKTLIGIKQDSAEYSKYNSKGKSAVDMLIKMLDEKIVNEDVDFSYAIENLFDGQDLSEEFKQKTQTIFEAALNEAVREKLETVTEELTEQFESQIEQITEEFETQLSEEVDNATKDIVEKLDAYLDYVAEEWLAENEVALESGIRVQMAESLFDDLKTVFENHNIDVSDEKIDLVADLEEQVSRLEGQLNEAVNDTIDLQRDKLEAEKMLGFVSVCEGLTDTQVERLRSLSEDINAKSVNEYVNKLETIKESFFAAKKSARKEREMEILEEVHEPEKKKTIIHDDSVRAYTEAINRMLKK